MCNYIKKPNKITEKLSDEENRNFHSPPRVFVEKENKLWKSHAKKLFRRFIEEVEFNAENDCNSFSSLFNFLFKVILNKFLNDYLVQLKNFPDQTIFILASIFSHVSSVLLEIQYITSSWNEWNKWKMSINMNRMLKIVKIEQVNSISFSTLSFRSLKRQNFLSMKKFSVFVRFVRALSSDRQRFFCFVG